MPRAPRAVRPSGPGPKPELRYDRLPKWACSVCTILKGAHADHDPRRLHTSTAVKPRQRFEAEEAV